MGMREIGCCFFTWIAQPDVVLGVVAAEQSEEHGEIV